jgi:hypothetical protein
MRSPIRLLIVTAAVLLSAAQIAPAKTLHPRSQAIPPEAAPWCLHAYAGGVACYADFQGCMVAAEAIKGNCLLNESWRAKYGDKLPPLERRIYGGIPDKCLFRDWLRCY